MSFYTLLPKLQGRKCCLSPNGRDEKLTFTNSIVRNRTIWFFSDEPELFDKMFKQIRLATFTSFSLVEHLVKLAKPKCN